MAGSPIGQFDPSQIKPPQGDPFAPRPDLINAMIEQESSGKAGAIGKVGEVGLMQIRPETAQMYGIHPDQLRDPATNRRVGSQYFADMLKRYKGNEFLALVAYNSGPGRVDKGQLLPQSVKYASRILSKAGGGSKAGAQPPAPNAAAPAIPSGSSGMPSFMSQSEFAPQSNVKEIPSMWERMKASIGGGLEGTAEAAEGPPPPTGAAGPVTALGGPSPAGPSAMPAPPKGAKGPVSAMPYGMKMSLHAGPLTLSQGPPETTGEETYTQKLGTMRQQIIPQIEEMQSLYEKRIKPKLSSGTISSVGQGLEYAEPGPMRYFNYQNDPDVQEWIVKSGQLSQALNSYYAAGGGGRGGVGYFGEITSPHVPHPPQGLREIFGVDSPTGQQWDLQKQGEQLPTLLHNLKRDQGTAGQETFQQWAPDEQELIDKYGR